MAVTNQEVQEAAATVADLMNRMTKAQWETFHGGMLMSESPDYSQQMIMDGFATLIHGYPTEWYWDTTEEDAEKAALERQRQIERGQLEMFPAGEEVSHACHQ